MRNKAHAKKRKPTNKKQGHDNLRRIHHIAAALYWGLRIVLMLWDRFSR